MLAAASLAALRPSRAPGLRRLLPLGQPSSSSLATTPRGYHAQGWRRGPAPWAKEQARPASTPRQGPKPLLWRPLGTQADRGKLEAEKGPEATSKIDQRLVLGSKEFWEDAVNIPNALTMTRLVATPGICWLIATDHYQLAIVSFWVAGFLDWVDGYLARRWNQMSVFGSFIDPLADKLFVAGTLLTLTAKGIIPLALGSLILGRDLVLVLGSFYVRYRTKPKDAGFFDMGQGSGVVAVEASMISKWNTLFQFGLIWFSMTHVAFNLPPTELMPAIWLISGGSTFASGYDYWRRANWDNIFAEANKSNSEKQNKQ